MAFQRVYRFLVWKTEYICITQLHSIDLPATRSTSPFLCFPLVLLLLHLAPSSSCSSLTFGVFLRFLYSIIRLSFIQAFSLCIIFFFFNHLSTFSSFSFLSIYLSLLDRRSIFISPFIFSCTFPAFSSSHPFL